MNDSMHTTNVQLGGTLGFCWGYLQEYGEKFTYRSRNDSKTAISLKRTPAWVTALKAGDLEHTALPAGSPQATEHPF